MNKKELIKEYELKILRLKSGESDIENIYRTFLDELERLEYAVVTPTSEFAMLPVRIDEEVHMLERCCKHMQRELENKDLLVGYHNLFTGNPYIVFANDTQRAVTYCPFCGTKINFINEPITT